MDKEIEILLEKISQVEILIKKGGSSKMIMQSTVIALVQISSSTISIIGKLKKETSINNLQNKNVIDTLDLGSEDMEENIGKVIEKQLGNSIEGVNSSLSRFGSITEDNFEDVRAEIKTTASKVIKRVSKKKANYVPFLIFSQLISFALIGSLIYNLYFY